MSWRPKLIQGRLILLGLVRTLANPLRNCGDHWSSLIETASLPNHHQRFWLLNGQNRNIFLWGRLAATNLNPTKKSRGYAHSGAKLLSDLNATQPYATNPTQPITTRRNQPLQNEPCNWFSSRTGITATIVFVGTPRSHERTTAGRLRI